MATKLQKGRKKFGHKGANRRFTNWEELSQQSREIEEERLRKAAEEGNENAAEDGEKNQAGGDSSKKVRVVDFDNKQDKVIEIGKEDSSSDEESEDSDEEQVPKSEIKTQNPIAESVDNLNRANTKLKKMSELDSVVQEDAQLSRREREAIEKERARQEYQRLHAAGKTEEARADLARLAIIRKQREEAAKKREDEKKTKDIVDAERKTKEQEQKAREEAEQEHPELEGKANKLKGKGSKKK